jgi:aryl-alcohol dehydrogenase-like predicted oxidoreductase
MAKAIGISVGSVQRIWRAHQLQPHRLRTLQALARSELCHQAD